MSLRAAFVVSGVLMASACASKRLPPGTPPPEYEVRALPPWPFAVDAGAEAPDASSPSAASSPASRSAEVPAGPEPAAPTPSTPGSEGAPDGGGPSLDGGVR